MTDGTSSLLQLAPLEAVLFDIDGTMVDSDPFHYDAFRVMLQEILFFSKPSIITPPSSNLIFALELDSNRLASNGGVPIDEDWFVKNIAGKHNGDIGPILFPNDHERGVKFLEDKEAMFRRIAKEKVEAINGLYKVTKWIEDRGIKRAAVTNSPRENAELMLSVLGLTDFFQALILGNDCERAKPFPDPYLKALDVLKVSKEHTFVFEDSVSGITAGVTAGLPTIGLTTRNPAELLNEAKPALLIKDYEDSKLWSVLDELDSKGKM